ncbi:hypothetical protein [Thermodesulfovibrio sp. TK110]
MVYKTTECPFCKGKARVFKYITICTSCNRSIPLKQDKEEAIDAVIVTDSNVVFENFAKVIQKTYRAQIVVPPMFERNERVFFFYTKKINENLFFRVCSDIMSVSQNIYVYTHDEEYFLSFLKKGNIHKELKKMIFHSFETSIFALKNSIEKLPAELKNKLLDDFLASYLHVISDEVSLSACEEILRQKTDAIFNFILK